MKIEYIYILAAVIIWIAGYFHTGKYVRPKWKIPGKFIFYIAVTAALVFWISHYGLIFIIGHPLIGLIFHIRICKKNDIKWLNCEPKKKYIQLQEDMVKKLRKE